MDSRIEVFLIFIRVYGICTKSYIISFSPLRFSLYGYDQFLPSSVAFVCTAANVGGKTGRRYV